MVQRKDIDRRNISASIGSATIAPSLNACNFDEEKTPKNKPIFKSPILNSNKSASRTQFRSKKKSSTCQKIAKRVGIQPKEMNSNIYAALDLGTNNCRLLVAKPFGKGFKIISSFSRIVRLGEGINETGEISEKAANRAIDALKACKSRIDRLGANRLWLVATQACRSSGNGQEFIDRVRSEVSLDIEIISAEREAQLALLGCANLVDHDSQGTIVFDVGGGSSELIWLHQEYLSQMNTQNISEMINEWVSLPLGVVSLSEMFGDRFSSARHYDSMVEEAKKHLMMFNAYEALRAAAEMSDITLLGTSGTVTTIAGVMLNLKRYHRDRVDGQWMNRGEARSISRKIANMTYEERCNHPCIGADRADLVVAGCAMVEAVLSSWNIERIRVADRGLREGLLMTMIEQDRLSGKI